LLPGLGFHPDPIVCLYTQSPAIVLCHHSKTLPCSSLFWPPSSHFDFVVTHGSSVCFFPPPPEHPPFPSFRPCFLPNQFFFPRFCSALFVAGGQECALFSSDQSYRGRTRPLLKGPFPPPHLSFPCFFLSCQWFPIILLALFSSFRGVPHSCAFLFAFPTAPNQGLTVDFSHPPFWFALLSSYPSGVSWSVDAHQNVLLFVFLTLCCPVGSCLTCFFALVQRTMV